jgi:hypothetical protein
MAGHVKVCELEMNEMYPIRQMGLWCNRTTQTSIGKVIGWLNKLSKKHLKEMKEWDEISIGRRKIVILPDEYQMMGVSKDITVFEMGELPVGKKVSYYGKAVFEVHYNSETGHADVYMVAWGIQPS